MFVWSAHPVPNAGDAERKVRQSLPQGAPILTGRQHIGKVSAASQMEIQVPWSLEWSGKTGAQASFLVSFSLVKSSRSLWLHHWTGPRTLVARVFLSQSLVAVSIASAGAVRPQAASPQGFLPRRIAEGTRLEALLIPRLLDSGSLPAFIRVRWWSR